MRANLYVLFFLKITKEVCTYYIAVFIDLFEYLALPPVISMCDRGSAVFCFGRIFGRNWVKIRFGASVIILI